MNLIDNGVKEIIKTTRIVTDTECYFEVTFKDWYGHTRTRNVMDIEDFKNASWQERNNFV